MSFVIILSMIVLILGIYFLACNKNTVEGFDSDRQCPNMLIQKGKKFYLYNSKLIKVPGVNPIEFDDLEDYTEFLAWQRNNGIRCPVLYLQEVFDEQGNIVYKTRPSVTDLQGGLPCTAPNPTLLVDASRDNEPFNDNSYPGYDQSDYYVGTTTPLDAMKRKI